MPLNQLKNIQIEFSLFDENGKPKAQLPVFIQYYEVTKNDWITIYKNSIEKGVLSIEETTKSRVKALMAFYKNIKNNQIPELRIVAQKKLYNLEKTQVLAAMHAFHIDEKNSVLQFDFGTAYLLNEQFLKEQKGFRNFIVVTSPYPIANEKENENQTLANELKKHTADRNKLKKELATSNAQLKIKEKQFVDLSNNLKVVEKQSKSATQDKSILQERFNTLEKKASEVNKALEKSNSNITTEQEEKKTLNAKTLDLDKKIKTVENSLNEAKKEIKRLKIVEKNYTSSKTDFEALNKDYGTIKKAVEQDSKSFKALQNKYDLLLKEKQESVEKSKIYKLEKKQFEDERVTLNDETKRLKTNLNNAEKGLAQKENKINELNLQVEELSKDVEFDIRPMPVSGVYTNIVNEIELAETLNNSNFKLANIQLKIKTLVHRDKQGINLQFLNPQTAKEVNGNSISEVVIDIESTPKEIAEPGNLPSLIGFTETAVRRILNNLNLRLNPVYQKNANVPSGDSFKQSPPVNSNIQNNQLITVIFSKNEQSS